MTSKSTVHPTLKDLAQRVGCSTTTVSLALAGHQRISAATTERVRRVAQELGYTPNASARALRSRRHGAIGLIMFGPGPSGSLSFYSEAVVAIGDEAFRRDHRLVLVNAYEAGKRQTLVQLIERAGIDGAVCIGTDVTAEDVRAMARRRFPFIFIGKREVPGAGVPYVSTDYLGAARLAVGHLVRLGHRRIAAVVDAAGMRRAWLRDRLEGFQVALREHGLPEAGVVLPVRRTGDGIDGAAWQRAGITAVYAVEQSIAGTVLRDLARQGIRVPGEIAVVASDDSPTADLLAPPLTAIRQSIGELGGLAARTLLSWLDGAPRAPFAASLPAALIVRRSCGAQEA